MALVTEHQSVKRQGAALLIGFGVVLLVIGAKLGLIASYGTDQPFADQWAAEGVGFLQAPLQGDLNWASFFWPHGEHRPAITRLITRGLIVANGGHWDCYVEIVFNLSIYALLLTAIWLLIRRVVDVRGWWVAACLIAGLFALPCAYENLLWGFQSQFIFMLACGAWHIAGTLESERIGKAWWFGQLAGWCGLFSIAAGVMSAALLVGISVVELVRRRHRRFAAWTLLSNTALLATGLWLLPASLARSEGIGTALHSAVSHTGYLLSWPQLGFWWSVILYAPVLAAAFAWCWSEGEQRAPRRLAAYGGWIVLVAFAVGYGRPITPETIGNRYYDVLIVGLAVNGLAILRALYPTSGRALPIWKALAAAWLLVAATGLWRLNQPTYSTAMLRQHRSFAEEQRDIIREFLVSGDSTALSDFNARTNRLPHFQLTVDLLRDPAVRPFLPPTLVPEQPQGALSRWAPRIAETWPAWISAGLIALFVGGRLLGAPRLGQNPAELPLSS